ncbi:MAG TPA: hypothetical protein VFR24_07180 [Candidatus Angelobacter sp.]|nr:hypothetical protein [Candidatus Angelobacter sp.]
MLIDIVGIEERRGLKRGKQILGDAFNELLGMTVFGKAFEP